MGLVEEGTLAEEGGATSEAIDGVEPETEDESAPEGTETTEEAGTEAGATTASEDTAPQSPEEDPAFQAVVKQIETVTARERTHPPAEASSAEAQAAAESPAEEMEGKAAANQVVEMEQVAAMVEEQPQLFDKVAFKAALLQKIEATAPETLEEADEFGDNNELGSVKSELANRVDQEKEQSQGPIEAKTNETPDSSTVEPKPTTPLQTPDAGSPPSGVGAARAAPKSKTETEVSAPFQERSQTLDQQLTTVEVPEETLEQSNEPEFVAAVQAKREAQTHASQAPTEYRQHEQNVLSSARGESETIAQARTEAMHDDRSQLLDQVGALQEQTKSEDEQKRTEIAAELQGIFDETTQQVNDRLDQLDQTVNQEFDQGAEEARTAFEDYVDTRMRAYKNKRYSGGLGWGRWLKDKAFGMPPEVERFYLEGRDFYLSKMDAVIDRVIDIVETGLVQAKELITKGRQKVGEYVAELPESLKEIGQEAASDIGTQFDELEQTVDSKKDQLIDSLAQKYTENLQQVDARIEELKAENKGLVDQALSAIGGVIGTILQLKDLLLGVLGKATSAIGTIIRDPIGFLGNLVNGIKQGLDNFLSNIGTHLQTGLVSWLTGTLTEAGIQLPEQFDIEGIFSLVMQILGLTYENIRAQVVKVLGEDTVSALEKTFEIFQVMVSKGIAGLWTYVQEKIGDLQAMVMDKIREVIATEVIEAGIKWIIGLLGPVGAFIKACTAIYDVVTFFLRRASEVASLVDAVMDSILAIAKGNLGGAAKLVEEALAQSIPTVIGFLANLLGLGDLPKKIQGVIKAIQEPINKGIQWVIEQAKQAVLRLGSALGLGGEEEVPEAVGDDIKSQVRSDLTQQLSEEPTDANQVESIVTTVYKKYADKGLKSLDVVEVQGKPGYFEVSAETSPGEEVAKFRLVKSDLQLRFPRTAALLAVNGRPVLQGRYLNKDRIHAEQWAVMDLRTRWNELIKSGIVQPGGENSMVLKVTRQPCQNCMDELHDFSQEYDVPYRLEIASTYGYETDVRIRLQQLLEAGVEVTPWNLANEARKLIGEDKITEAEFGELVQRAELEAYSENVRRMLAETDHIHASK